MDKVTEWETEMKSQQLDKQEKRQILDQKFRKEIKKWGNRSILGNVMIGDLTYVDQGVT
jgi:hypothetical protein